MTRTDRDRGPARPPDLALGRRPVLEALRAGVADEVLVARSSRRTPALREVVEAAGRAGVPIRRVEEDRIERLASGARHQGVAALIRRPPELTEADLEAGPWAVDAVVVVLDGVTDPQNLGAVARTAEAAGASALVVRRRRGAGVTPAALRASAGALLHLPMARVANVARGLRRLKEGGFWVVGLAAESSVGLQDTGPPDGPLALVAGAEGEGLSRVVRDACDELVSIPIRGKVASLNVSVAVAIALYHYLPR